MDPSRPKHLTPEAIKERLARADRLAAEGDYARARDIYESLIRGIHAWIKETASRGKKAGPTTRKSLRVLEKRLQALDSRIIRSDQDRPLGLQVFRMRLQNAELYAGRDLIPEARDIIRSLIDRIKTWQRSSRPTPEASKASEMALDVLRERLEIYQARSDYLEHRKPSQKTAPKTEPALGDDRAVLYLGLALCGGRPALHDLEALQEGRPLDRSSLSPYLALADLLSKNHENTLAGEIYQRLLRQSDPDPSTKAELLKKLAGIQEALGARREALKSYKEAVKLEGSGSAAAPKVEELGKELSRLRLTIATVTDHPRLFFGLSLLIAAFFMAFMPFAKTVDNVDYFTVEHD
ncbi:MAG: tetratricopeptide repeat protein, partial [Desulfobacteraceae bacterium]